MSPAGHKEKNRMETSAMEEKRRHNTYLLAVPVALLLTLAMVFVFQRLNSAPVSAAAPAHQTEISVSK